MLLPPPPSQATAMDAVIMFPGLDALVALSPTFSLASNSRHDFYGKLKRFLCCSLLHCIL